MINFTYNYKVKVALESETSKSMEKLYSICIVSFNFLNVTKEQALDTPEEQYLLFNQIWGVIPSGIKGREGRSN